ncbi:MAG: hypothetical protein A3C84_00090 [Candidatus Ryanbacteria bacterium RIFCSPHIGHO2_02_FULL_48_12]|uniref:ATP-grasp domain-containing protein n=1 Tax=Candidatus Ryanbacteria bacterium RIFCSPHIGHO2_01_FULL_48_27 TaxID=1802115 RepID=A0A1G2G5B1_9BACT|nr:MAG: hypothetical protein A2756_00340 [Candidatus Ryanbacteria bacterium RIFCSPHIGHO2_01_FULL_48_27]OGZ50377.1 MAG: hypothetical protein A3C84_00090 [Candidatus Ryanbacteria bacterium RIFCSPHIGHO2_02_FULL_48_12]
MRLYEFEAKALIAKYGIPIPDGFEISKQSDNTLPQPISYPVVVKAQVLSGKRSLHHGILFAQNAQEFADALTKIYRLRIQGQEVDTVRIEKKIAAKKELYLSFSYDSLRHAPLLMLSHHGGVGIEKSAREKSASLETVSLPLLRALPTKEIQNALSRIGLDPKNTREVLALIEKLYTAFLQEDMHLLEINPLMQTYMHGWIAADAKIKLDKNAFWRHPTWDAIYPPRSPFLRPLTTRELSAQIIDTGAFYYRGTAGTYMDLDGDIGILFSGGGASLVCMDALLKAGGKPANYSEYSGNPPQEKVYQLARIVMSKPNLRGLWIAGAIANFTQIDETFAGIIRALEEARPSYPIVIRRAGPGDVRAKTMMEAVAQKLHLNLAFFGKEIPMSETAAILVAKAY